MKTRHLLPNDDRFEVPAGNVLDLRLAKPQPPKEKPRVAAREPFWKKGRIAKPPPVVQRVKPVRAPRVWPDPRQVLRRFRLGSFPIVAIMILALIGVAGLVGRVVEVRARIVTVAERGLDSLRVASAKAGARDFNGAAAEFQTAEQAFADAESAFSDINPTLARIVSNLPYAGSQFRSAQHLVAAGRFMASAGERFSGVAEPLLGEGEGFSAVASFLDRLNQDRSSLGSMVSDTTQALDELAQVSVDDLPAEYQETIARVQSILPGLKQTLGSLQDGLDVIAGLLGVDQPTERLFIFQNANELRPTGGFIGSFALIRLDNGVFKILDAPDRGSLGVDEYLPDTITPPLPLQVITPSWYFRDSNWFPNFPTSAQQMNRLYETARGFRSDGIVAITNTLIERLLSVTGPVEMASYGVTVNAENFTSITQEQTEKKYDLRVNDPKRFIADLIPVVAQKLAGLGLDAYPRLLATVAESAASGDLQFWSPDPVTQARISRLGWSGAMPDPVSGDFLELVDTNIGGGKTDGVISETIHDTLTIADDGSVVARVDVTRKHNGTPGDAFTGSRNRTYHRLYVPRGSTLLEAEGFTVMPPETFRTLPAGSTPDELLSFTEGRIMVDEATRTRTNDEFGKTVFGNWTEIDPGETKTFSLTYKLPFTLDPGLSRYDLTLWKQAGTNNRIFELTVKLPAGDSVAWTSSGTSSQTAAGTLLLGQELTKPIHFGFVAKLKNTQ